MKDEAEDGSRAGELSLRPSRPRIQFDETVLFHGPGGPPACKRTRRGRLGACEVNESWLVASEQRMQVAVFGVEDGLAFVDL